VLVRSIPDGNHMGMASDPEAFDEGLFAALKDLGVWA
jgi:hypothetical protein